MFRFALAVTALLAFALPTRAQTALSFNVNPVPVIDVTIGGQPAQLEVALEGGGHVYLGRQAAARLRVRTVPFPHATIRLNDGDGAIRASLGIQRVRFAGNIDGPRVIVTPMEASTHADGVIGLPVIPFDSATFILRTPRGDERDIVFPLPARSLFPSVTLAGQELRLGVSFRRDVTMFNRLAAAALDGSGAIVADGAPVVMEVFGGMTAMVQPVRTGLTLDGLPLGRSAARTNAGLMGQIAAEDIVVVADTELPPPGLSLGHDALSRCTSLRIDRAAQRFTLRCSPS